MKTYKNLEALERRLIQNNGKKVDCWDDEGIKVNGKKYFLFQYGDMGNDCYITFRNIGRKGRHNGISEPIGENDSFISVDYDLKSNSENPNRCDIFEFLGIRDNW